MAEVANAEASWRRPIGRGADGISDSWELPTTKCPGASVLSEHLLDGSASALGSYPSDGATPTPSFGRTLPPASVGGSAPLEPQRHLIGSPAPRAFDSVSQPKPYHALASMLPHSFLPEADSLSMKRHDRSAHTYVAGLSHGNWPLNGVSLSNDGLNVSGLSPYGGPITASVSSSREATPSGLANQHRGVSAGSYAPYYDLSWLKNEPVSSSSMPHLFGSNSIQEPQTLQHIYSSPSAQLDATLKLGVRADSTQGRLAGTGAEAGSLQRQVDELLQTNATLKSQLRTRESALTAVLPNQRAAWDAERRGLQNKITGLIERRRCLEADAEAAKRVRVAAAAGNPSGVGAASSSSGSLELECSSLKRRLCEAETAQIDVAKRAADIEARLVKTRQELEVSAKPLTPRSEGLADAGRQRQELEDLRQRLADTRIEREKQKRQRDGHEALAREHGVLRGDKVVAAERLAVVSQALTTGTRRVNSLRARAEDVQREQSAELQSLGERLRSLTQSQACNSMSLNDAKPAEANSKNSVSECNGALAQIRLAHNALLAQAGQRADNHRSAVAAARSLSEQLDNDRKQCIAQLEHARRQMSDWESVLSERRHASSFDQIAQTKLNQLKYNIERLVQQFNVERARGVELTHEITIARKASNALRSSSVDRSGNERARSSPSKNSRGRAQREGRQHENLSRYLNNHPCTTKQQTENYFSTRLDRDAQAGWHRTRERLQRELQELRSWKQHATSSMQQCHEGLEAAQRGFAEQNQYGRELEAAIERLGRRAQCTAEGNHSPNSSARYPSTACFSGGLGTFSGVGCSTATTVAPPSVSSSAGCAVPLSRSNDADVAGWVQQSGIGTILQSVLARDVPKSAASVGIESFDAHFQRARSASPNAVRRTSERSGLQRDRVSAQLLL